MKTTIQRTLALAVGLMAVGPALADAATVALDYPNSLILSVVSDAGMFRYRLSNTNFDTSIANGGVIPPATWAASQNLGTHTALNGATWDFVLSYTAGVGYSWNLTWVSGGSPSLTSSNLGWTSPVGSISPTRPFNAIEIYAQVQNGSASYTSGTIDVTGMAFSGAGLTIHPTYNALRNLHDDKTIAPGPGGNDLDLEWIAADVDLSLYTWTLTGRVVATFGGYTSGNLDERIKFNIKTVFVQAPVKTEASTWGRVKALYR